MQAYAYLTSWHNVHHRAAWKSKGAKPVSVVSSPPHYTQTQRNTLCMDLSFFSMEGTKNVSRNSFAHLLSRVLQSDILNTGILIVEQISSYHIQLSIYLTYLSAYLILYVPFWLCVQTYRTIFPSKA